MDARYIGTASKQQLFLTIDEYNKSITSANYRSYTVKGTCHYADQEVVIQIGTFGSYSTKCEADKSFSLMIDLDGITEGSYSILAKQDETATNITSLDTKYIVADLTAPTVTVNAPDNRQNYALSSLRANYPISGTCSDPLNIVKVSTSLSQVYMAVCSPTQQWEISLDLSAETASSVEFYVQHFDSAGNISSTATTNIAYPQWQKISPTITSTGVSSVRTMVQYGDSGRILLTVPLRNDDLIDLGIVNFNNTGLSRLNPLSGQWAVDSSKPIIPVPKYNRALYARVTMGRAQLRELHSVKIDGTDDKILVGPTAANPVGGVTNYLLTPNQEFAIVLADIEATDNEFSLYAVSMATGAITKISGALAVGGDVKDFLLTPNGQEVIFRADKDTDEIIELYAVKVDGTNLRRLGPALGAGKAAYVGYKISPDSKWVLFRENQSFVSGANTGMMAVSLENGDAISLIGSAPSGFVEVGSFSPDSKYIAYRIDRTTATCYALEVYNLQTRTETEVSAPCASVSTDILSYAWANDSSKLGYGMVTTSTNYDLYVANVDGSNRLKLTSAAVGRNGVVGGYKDKTIVFTPDSKTIVFLADFSGVVRASTTDMRFDMYSIKADGSGSPVLLTPNSNSNVIRDFPVVEIAPSSDRVAFIADLEVDTKYEMYLAALDGSVIKKLNPTLLPSQGSLLFGVQNYFFDWVRNTVAFLADATIDNVQGLYLSSLGLPTPSLSSITLPQVDSGDVTTVLASANGSKVLIRLNPTNDSEMHLFTANVDGSGFHRVTKDFPATGGTLRGWVISSDGSKIIYIGDQDTAGVEELYVVDTAGGAPVKVSDTISAVGGNVTKYKLNEVTGKIIYQGDLTTDGVMDLYAVNLDGTGHTKLTPAYGHKTTLSEWEVSPDGSYVVLRWDYHTIDKIQIDKIPVTGGAPVLLNVAIGASSDLSGFAISPDSAWVCYFGGMAVSRRNDARVVLASTPATSYLMDVGIDTIQNVSDCDFTPDSAFVTLKGDWYSDGKTAMKTYKIATQTLTLLNSSLPFNSHTSWSQALVEGANKRIITLSETSPEIYEIYSMNYDGTDIRKISQTPYPGGMVNANSGQAVRILEDTDKTIVYTGLLETLGKWDLFAVKWDGTQQRKLVTLPSFADIYEMNVSAISNKVYFRSDYTKDGVLSLYSVNTDGTGLKNFMPGLTGNAGVWYSHAVTTSHVFFVSDAYQSQLLELFVDTL